MDSGYRNSFFFTLFFVAQNAGMQLDILLELPKLLSPLLKCRVFHRGESSLYMACSSEFL